MRVAISADTRNFDAAMRHVRGQAAQARRAVAPTMGAMGMGGAGRMAGMGLGIAAMSGPMAAVAAATAAVASAVSAMKERRQTQDESFREIVESGLNPAVQAQLTAIAKMASPSARSADMLDLMRSFREMGEQQRLDMSSTLGPDLMKALSESTGADFVNAIRQAQRQDPDFASSMGDKAGALIRSLSQLLDTDVARAFAVQADLGSSALRSRQRIESLGARVQEEAVPAQFQNMPFASSRSEDQRMIRQRVDADRLLKEVNRIGQVPPPPAPPAPPAPVVNVAPQKLPEIQIPELPKTTQKLPEIQIPELPKPAPERITERERVVQEFAERPEPAPREAVPDRGTQQSGQMRANAQSRTDADRHLKELQRLGSVPV